MPKSIIQSYVKIYLMSKYNLEDFINLPDVIKSIRKKKKLSQLKLAHKLGISVKTISGYETNRIHPPINIFFEIINIGGLAVEVKENIYKSPKPIELPYKKRKR